MLRLFFGCRVSNSLALLRAFVASLALASAHELNPHALAAEAPPAITTQPASQTVNAGSSVILTVVTNSSDPGYQWKKDGFLITGATNATYFIPSAQTGDSGSYTVDVTNSGGPVATNAATVTVNAIAPTITTHPLAQTVNYSAPATFTVIASGTEPLTYQWQKNGTSITSATSSTYTIPVTSISDLAQYGVIVTNTAGTIWSNSASLTLNSPAFTAPAPNGFASTSTGGGNATPVLVTTAADLRAHAESDSPTVITIAGTIDLNSFGTAIIGPINVKSNKTIQGLDAQATLVGSLELGAGVNNVIIRGLNLTHPSDLWPIIDQLGAGAGISTRSSSMSASFVDTRNDNMPSSGGTPLVIKGATNIFVTHCTFFNGADHLATVTTGADNIVFAWCEFYYSAHLLIPDRFGLLIGNSTGETKPLRVTLHHNSWSDLIAERMPATTYGHVHQYSNYFKPAAATPNTAATAALANSQLLSERNLYHGIATPLTKSSGGLIRALGNTYTATTGTAADAGTDNVFVPRYGYMLSKNSDLAELTAAYAGNTSGAASAQPVSFTGYSGGRVQLDLSVGGSISIFATTDDPALSGPGNTYQWRLNSMPILGATSSEYVATNVQTSQSGSYTAATTLTNGNTIVTTPWVITVNPATGAGGSNPPPASGGGGSPTWWFLSALSLLIALRHHSRK